MTDLPVVDAHQHFWDLGRNYLPWLCDEEVVPFRYGDYSALRRNYLPRDYLRDAAGQDVVKTVYVETEWDPRDFVGETRWLQEIIAETGLPHAIVAGARLDAPTWKRYWQATPPSRRCAASVTSRGRRAPRRTCGPGLRARWAIRRGAAAMPCSRGTGCRSTCRRPGGILPKAAALARDFPNTQIILNHTGLPADRTPEGLAGWRRRCRRWRPAQCRGQDLRPRSAGAPWTVAANGPIVRDTIAIFGVERCMFASNFPVDGLCADFETIFSGFKTIVADLSQAEQTSLFCANALKFYRLDPLSLMRRNVSSAEAAMTHLTTPWELQPPRRLCGRENSCSWGSGDL